MTPIINVALIDFHGSKDHEMVIENEDGSYTILIDARLSDSGRLNEYNHAMDHINGNDYEKPDVQQIESRAHGLPDNKEKVYTTERFITSVNVSTWLETLQRRRAMVKRALLYYEKRRQILEEYGLSHQEEIAEAPLSLDREVRRLHKSNQGGD